MAAVKRGISDGLADGQLRQEATGAINTALHAPELTQTAYRGGDSTSNIIAPMMSYFALIGAFFERYDKKSGIGTVVATMLPYTIAFMIVWSILLMIWMTLGLPVGPGSRLML